MFAELMCSALEYAGNFTIKEVSTMNHSGLFNESTETRPGAISELVNDEADIISFVMEMTEERLKVYDFPVPKIMRIKLALMVNRRRNQRINIRSDYLKVSKEKINKYKNTLDSNSSPCLHSPFYLATENLVKKGFKEYFYKYIKIKTILSLKLSDILLVGCRF